MSERCTGRWQPILAVRPNSQLLATPRSWPGNSIPGYMKRALTSFAPRKNCNTILRHLNPLSVEVRRTDRSDYPVTAGASASDNRVCSPGMTACALPKTGTPVPARSRGRRGRQALARYSARRFARRGQRWASDLRSWLWLADAEARHRTADSLFRWASTSKTLTATAIMCPVKVAAQSRHPSSILNQHSAYNGNWAMLARQASLFVKCCTIRAAGIAW